MMGAIACFQTASFKILSAIDGWPTQARFGLEWGRSIGIVPSVPEFPFKGASPAGGLPWFGRRNSGSGTRRALVALLLDRGRRREQNTHVLGFSL